MIAVVLIAQYVELAYCCPCVLHGCWNLYDLLMLLSSPIVKPKPSENWKPGWQWYCAPGQEYQQSSSWQLAVLGCCLHTHTHTFTLSVSIKCSTACQLCTTFLDNFHQSVAVETEGEAEPLQGRWGRRDRGGSRRDSGRGRGKRKGQEGEHTRY